ncbi:MAG: metal-dependent hydrolase [Candidatus Bathyarchaeia archaeon]
MKIKFLSHACFEISDGRRILIDPYFTGNSLAPKYEGTPDIILVTHEHFDHFDKAFISRFPKAKVVAPPVCEYSRAIIMRVGEKREVDGVTVEMISASHPQSRYPTGYVVEFEGKRIVHLGDCYLDGVKPLERVDVLLIPIGGTYTMNVDEALKALDVLKPKLAIPMHYNTFPQVRATPEAFKGGAEKKGYNVKILRIGEEAVL